MAKTKKYPGTLEVRGDSYRSILYVDGKRHTFNLGEVTRAEAISFNKRQHEQLEKRAQRRRLGLPDLMAFTGIGAAACRKEAPKGEEPVPAGFLDKYELEVVPTLAPSTQKSYCEILARARLWFDKHHPDLQVDQVARAHIVEYLAWRARQQFRPAAGGKKRGPASKRTVQKERATLHAAMEYAVMLELRDSNPVHAVKVPKPDERPPVILDAGAYEGLLQECQHDPMLALYALALGEGGERCESEALWFRWPDIDLEEGFMWVAHDPATGRRTKGKKGRWVPMTPRLHAAMREHFAAFRFATYDGKPTEWVFHHTRTRRHAKAGARIVSLRHSLKAAAARAGIPDEWHLHDLRHRRATVWVAEEGRSLVHAQEALGHADVRTTRKYTHVNRSHLRQLVDPPTAPAPEPARRQA